VKKGLRPEPDGDTLCPVIDRLLAVGDLAAVARPELVMTLPRTVADVLSDHVLFEVECIDRMYLNVYVPTLQTELALIGYLRGQLGCQVTSTAPLAAVSDAFVAAIRRFLPRSPDPGRGFRQGAAQGRCDAGASGRLHRG
jgi:hypothetical protein